MVARPMFMGLLGMAAANIQIVTVSDYSQTGTIEFKLVSDSCLDPESVAGIASGIEVGGDVEVTAAASCSAGATTQELNCEVTVSSDSYPAEVHLSHGLVMDTTHVSVLEKIAFGDIDYSVDKDKKEVEIVVTANQYFSIKEYKSFPVECEKDSKKMSLVSYHFSEDHTVLTTVLSSDGFSGKVKCDLQTKILPNILDNTATSSNSQERPIWDIQV